MTRDRQSGQALDASAFGSYRRRFVLPFGATSDDINLLFEKRFLDSFDASRADETTQHIEC